MANLPIGFILYPLLGILIVALIIISIKELKKITIKGGDVTFIIYNIILIFIVLTTDWTDWGAILMAPIVFFLTVVFSPIMGMIVYKNTNENLKSKKILISYLCTLLTVGISVIVHNILINF